MRLTIRLDQVDTHVHVSLWVSDPDHGGSRNGTLCFRPDEWVNFDAAMQRAYGSQYLLLNTTKLENLQGAKHTLHAEDHVQRIQLP